MACESSDAARETPTDAYAVRRNACARMDPKRATNDGGHVRVSEFYNLGVTQPSLEFVDVDVTGDAQVFVDPHAFGTISSDWARECVSLLQDFYGEVLAAVRAGDRSRGMYLLARLGESNEAHLGLSSAQARGSGVAGGLASDIYDALGMSSAVVSGHLNEVQETVLFVDGVGHDRVSDMTINIIRRQLIAFTQDMCNLHGIPMVQGLDSGPMWDRHTQSWTAERVELPMPNGKLLFVPIAVVRKSPTFDPGDYLSHFVLPTCSKSNCRPLAHHLFAREPPSDCGASATSRRSRFWSATRSHESTGTTRPQTSSPSFWRTTDRRRLEKVNRPATRASLRPSVHRSQTGMRFSRPFGRFRQDPTTQTSTTGWCSVY